MSEQQRRTLFDWCIFLLIYALVVGGASYFAVSVYGWNLGVWVAVSATIAGLVALYLFHSETGGTTLMRLVLAIVVAMNLGYLFHNSAHTFGVEKFNSAQVQKYEAGMAAAARASSRAVAKQLSLSARDATTLERVFRDDVASTAALLAFAELAIALICFAVASRRPARTEQRVGKPAVELAPPERQTQEIARPNWLRRLARK